MISAPCPISENRGGHERTRRRGRPELAGHGGERGWEGGQDRLGPQREDVQRQTWGGRQRDDFQRGGRDDLGAERGYGGGQGGFGGRQGSFGGGQGG